MARGWESKSVESQMEAAEEKPSGQPMTAGQASLHRQRESLRLARSRVLQQLQLAQEPRYIKLLNDTLAHLDGQLTKLG